MNGDWSQQVVELKVGLHCDECIKKILKAIKKIEGTYYCFSNFSSETKSGWFLCEP